MAPQMRFLFAVAALLEFISMMGNFAGAWVFVIVGLVPWGSDE